MKPMVNIAAIVQKTVQVTVSKENAVAMKTVRSLKVKEAPAQQIADKTQ
jgi:hypothetical protein